jgi:hypothetical protein
MEIADIVFRVGVGIGVVLVGAGVVVAAISLRPLTRDVRSLARDAERLTRLLEEEMPELLARAGSDVAGAAESSEDVAFSIEHARIPAQVGTGRPAIGSVQSRDEDEDGRIA